MVEWFKAAVLKTAEGESSPGVRIPLPPPILDSKYPYCWHEAPFMDYGIASDFLKMFSHRPDVAAMDFPANADGGAP